MKTRSDPLGFAAAALDELAAQDLRRTARVVTSGPGPVIEIDGERLLNFCSNNCLGLAEHPDVTRAAADAVQRWGAGATASPLVAGTSELIDDLQRRLAAWRRAEAALVFSTGFQTNLGVVGALVGKGDLVVADRRSHASLIDAAKLSGATLRTFPHGDLNRLDALLANARARALVLVDGVYSMDGDLADLPALLDLTDRHGALLLVDDAHAVGVFGATGSGIAEHFGVEAPPHLIQTATFSKAFGSQGGFVTGSRTLIDLILNRARAYIFSTGLAPAAAAAARASLDIIQQDPARRARLWEIRDRLAEGLQARGWDLGKSQSPILPLMAGEAGRALALAERLRRAGALGVAIRPPTVPPGRARVRLTVMATHTDEHLDQLLRAVGSPERD
jgi:8-amino-7-oxononanoate synthase